MQIIFGKDAVARFSYKSCDRVLDTLRELTDSNLLEPTEENDAGQTHNFQKFLSLNGVDLLSAKRSATTCSSSPGSLSRCASIDNYLGSSGSWRWLSQSFDSVMKESESEAARKEARVTSSVSHSAIWRKLGDAVQSFISTYVPTSPGSYDNVEVTVPNSTEIPESCDVAPVDLTDVLYSDHEPSTAPHSPLSDFYSDLDEKDMSCTEAPSDASDIMRSPVDSWTPRTSFDSLCPDDVLDPAPRPSIVVERAYQSILEAARLENTVDLMPAGRIISIVPRAHLDETEMMKPPTIPLFRKILCLYSLFNCPLPSTHVCDFFSTRGSISGTFFCLADGCVYVDIRSEEGRLRLRTPVITLEAITDHLIDRYALALAPAILKVIPKEYADHYNPACSCCTPLSVI